MAGGLYTPVQVEEAAETVPTVRRAGAAVVGPRGTQQVVVILETEEGYRPGGRPARPRPAGTSLQEAVRRAVRERSGAEDRKSTRLNSSHVAISYAVFCL